MTYESNICQLESGDSCLRLTTFSSSCSLWAHTNVWTTEYNVAQPWELAGHSMPSYINSTPLVHASGMHQHSIPGVLGAVGRLAAALVIVFRVEWCALLVALVIASESRVARLSGMRWRVPRYSTCNWCVCVCRVRTNNRIIACCIECGAASIHQPIHSTISSYIWRLIRCFVLSRSDGGLCHADLSTFPPRCF